MARTGILLRFYSLLQLIIRYMSDDEKWKGCITVFVGNSCNSISDCICFELIHVLCEFCDLKIAITGEIDMPRLLFDSYHGLFISRCVF